MEPIITINGYPIGWEWLDKVPLEDFNWLIEILSVMTDNTDTYEPRDKQQPPPLRTHQITNKRNVTNPTKRYNHNRYNITTMNIIYHIIRIILSVGTILTLIRNEKIYQAYKYTHPTNKIRYIISQTLILTLYTSSLILVSYTYRIILRYI